MGPDFLHVRQLKTKLNRCLFAVLWDFNHLSRTPFAQIFFLLYLFHHPLQKCQWILLFRLFAILSFCLIDFPVINWVFAGLTNSRERPIHFPSRRLFIVLIHKVRFLMLIFQNLFVSHSLHLKVFLVFGVVLDFFVDKIYVLFLYRVEYLWQDFVVWKALVVGVLFHNECMQLRRIHFLYYF